MKLSTGRVPFPLTFDNGEVVEIFLNPHDDKLQERINNFEQSINERIKKLNFEKHKDAFNGSATISNVDFSKMLEMSAGELEALTKQVDAINEIDKLLENEVCKEIDDIFKSDVSSKAFKFVPPLAMVLNEKGEPELYILQVLRALSVEIQKYGDKMTQAMNKHTAKYSKK